jgi:MFS family permease
VTNRTVVGALICGQVADFIGRRNAIIIALCVSFAAISIEFTATTNAMFFAGKFVNGFATGTLQTVSGTYIGEVRRF